MGKCKPKESTLYINGDIMISLIPDQRWEFKYGILSGNKVVKLSRDNVRMYLTKDKFEDDWEIIERVDNEAE